MERKILFARAKLLVRRETLQKKLAELQELKEQVRLAEIAARQSSQPRETLDV